jgi:mono/diheme cytochrome c family protein
MQYALATWLIAVAFATASTPCARAQGVDGRAEYLARCATCHGDDGKGNGPLGAKLRTKPADLTLLARRTRSGFSPEAVYQMIDGRKSARAHRLSDMPIWGCRQAPPPPRRAKDTSPKTGQALFDLSCDPEPVIRSRILAIVDYLSGIQAK